MRPTAYRFRAPAALRPGSRLAIVAPSSPFDREAFDAGVERLRDRYDVRFEPHLFERKGYLAGDDARRLGELQAALVDPSVDALVAARGGFGATRLLGDLDIDLIADACKLLVGFSDVTALHAAWARAGVRSLHAPMVSALGRAGGALVDRWMSAVEGATPEPIGHLTALAGRGQAEGPLVGGNLAVLAALAGTPFAPPLDGSILFLEDVGERPYRIDRMLTTLRHAGWLERVSGVVLGAFTGAEPAPDGTTSDEVLAERLGDLSVPVLGAIPAGHVDDNLELPLGARVALDGTRGELRFLEAATV